MGSPAPSKSCSGNGKDGDSSVGFHFYRKHACCMPKSAYKVLESTILATISLFQSAKNPNPLTLCLLTGILKLEEFAKCQCV